MRPALSAAIALLGTLLLGAGPPPRTVSPKSVPPCHVPAMKVRDWQTVWIDPPRSFRMPPTFVSDTSVRYHHGGRRWKSGKRQFEMINGYWGEGSFRSSSSSECTDTLAGIPFRLITAYREDSKKYVAVAVPVRPAKGSLGPTLVFIGESPNRADQRLFLAIFRTLRADSTGAAE